MRRFGIRVVLAAGVAALLAGAWTTIAGGAVDFRNFNPAAFPASPSITNQWLPTIPATQFVYEGTSLVGRNRVVPHRIVSIVSDMTKVVDGVRIPGQEIEYPMAIVILGGLITATLQNLFIVPSLYLRYGKSRAER